ncbi:patatin-like phospholipase family protein [Thermohalobacter berrensis]|uniref:Patatin family protein n=1 Tax=Thermohalobacter berrensis TaxID=99594 RepID=A0A419T8H3_9FIRM|nr:patatin family protein [Thermohalobacter berrensis]RKD33752.1 patatin family protein [Thermohalobacter berrensis]
MKKLGLVLEGGGMRGVYTSGVLDYFMEKELYFPYVIGVSAGACNALSYLSRQKGRSRDINLTFADDPRYIDVKNVFKRENVFNLDFLFNDISKKLIPFDYERFEKAEEKFVVCCTDCNTGKPVYFDKDSCSDIFNAVMASSSLPFVNFPVKLEGKTLLDGGITDSIPIKKSIKDGNSRNVIILTRQKGYRKKPFRFRRLAKRFYPEYDKLVDAICNRYKGYNTTLDFIDRLENDRRAFVIRPSKPLKVKRTEKDKERLKEIYKLGYEDAEKLFDDMMNWIKEENKRKNKASN